MKYRNKTDGRVEIRSTVRYATYEAKAKNRGTDSDKLITRNIPRPHLSGLEIRVFGDLKHVWPQVLLECHTSSDEVFGGI